MSRPFFPVHDGALGVFNPESKNLLSADFVEKWEGLRSFFVSLIVAGFFGYKWYQKKKDRMKDHKLDHYIRTVMEIERQQMSIEAEKPEEALIELQSLLDRVTNLRQECFEDFSVHRLQDDQGTDCFLELCASMSEKLNAKMTRLRLGGEIARLADAVEKKL